MTSCQGSDAGGATIERAGDLEVMRWPLLGWLGVEALVTTRGGGVSRGPYESLNLALHVGDDPVLVRENRRRAAAALDAQLTELVFANQVHGVRVATVSENDAGRGTVRRDDAVPDTDALVTRSTGVVLAVLVADCAPILMVDPEARVLAAVHAGWRGAVRGAAGSALTVMCELGAMPARVTAFVGPGASRATYEVGTDVADAARARFGERAAEVLAPMGKSWRFDVAGANRLGLITAGIPEDHVHVADFDTADPRWFSDREARPCGRFALLARLR